MSVEENIQQLRDDMKEIKEALKEIKAVLSSFSERFVSNEKDLESMVKEYMRTQSQIEEVKKEFKAGDDYVWGEVRKSQADCKERHNICGADVDKKIDRAANDIKKDIKIWVYVSILTALGSVAISFINKILAEVVK